MSDICDRCGRLPLRRVAPVHRVLIPGLLEMTRTEPVEDEPGWVDLESSSGNTARLCPSCAALPALPPSNASDLPQEGEGP